MRGFARFSSAPDQALPFLVGTAHMLSIHSDCSNPCVLDFIAVIPGARPAHFAALAWRREFLALWGAADRVCASPSDARLREVGLPPTGGFPQTRPS